MKTIVIDTSTDSSQGSELDTQFKHEIAHRPGGENIRKCFACGTCTAGCPAFQADHEYNPRRIIRLILLGLRKEVLSSPAIWLCHQCYACSANCPQNVDFSHIMMAVRDIAVDEGFHPRARLQSVDRIGQMAAEFRRDCVQLLTGQGGVSAETIREHVEATIKAVEGAARGGS
jgi:heterodisulfide reductase subunit C